MAETAPPIGEPRWVPADYVDEVSPPGRASADDWIIRLADGALALFGDDEIGVNPRLLRDGEIVCFMTTTAWGEGTVTVSADGNFIASRPMPPAAEQVWIPFDGPLADSLEDLARAGVLDELKGGEGPGEYPVYYGTWSGVIRLRFDAATGRFNPEAANDG